MTRYISHWQTIHQVSSHHSSWMQEELLATSWNHSPIFHEDYSIQKWEKPQDSIFPTPIFNSHI